MSENKLKMPDRTDLTDPRSAQEQNTAFDRALNIVTRSYLTQLKDRTIVERPKESPDLQLSNYTCFYRLNRIVSEPKEDYLQKLITILYTAYSLEVGIAVLIHSDGAQTEYYFGITTDGRSPVDMGEAMKEAFCGCFPGSELVCVKGDDMAKIVKAAVGMETGSAEASDSGEFSGNVAAISGMPGIRDADKHTVENYVQGIENMTDALHGCSYTLIIKADPVDGSGIEELRRAYQSISTQLSPYVQTTYNFNISDAVGISHSDGKSSNHTKTVNDGYSILQQNTKNESKAEGSNHAQATNEGAKYALGGAGIAAGLTAAIATISAVALGGALVPAIVAALPKVGAAAVAGSTAGDIYGSSKKGIKTEGTTEQKTTGSGETTGINFNHGSSEADTTGTNTNDTYSQNRTDSQSKQFMLESKRIADVRKTIDDNLKHLDECVNYGGFECAAYVVADTYTTSQRVASLYSALMRGDQSGLQSTQVTTWETKTAKQLIPYLEHFEHPKFSYPLMEQETVLTPALLESGRELAVQIGLPKRSIPGVAVIRHAAFGCNPPEVQAPLPLGTLYRMGEESKGLNVNLDRKNLTAHTFITGSTGSGKSNTVYTMLNELCPKPQKNEDKGPHFLVIEPAKGEYKDVFGGRKDVSVYGTNVKKAPLLLRLNPFSFPNDTHVLEHIDRLVEVFNACWPMYAAMPAVLKAAIEAAYVNCGWNLQRSTNLGIFPTFHDVMKALPEVIDSKGFSNDTQGDYKGALLARLESLTNGIYGQVLCAPEEVPSADLFDKNVIIDLSRVGSSETKALLMGILVLKLQEYRMEQRAMGAKANDDLRHITVLEEAHTLLRRTSTEQSQESSNLQGKSVEMLTNAIAEMRTYGEGFIIADQAPGLLDMAVIRNTNTKIILLLPDESDRKLVGKAADLNDDQIVELAQLDTGVAAVYQNNWLEPVLCKVTELSEAQKQPMVKPSQDDISISTNDFFNWLLSNEELMPLNDLQTKRICEWIMRLDTGIDAKRILLKALESKQRPEKSDLQFALYAAVKGKHLIENSYRVCDSEGYILRQIEAILLVHEDQARMIREQITSYVQEASDCLPEHKDIERKGADVR